MEPSAMSTLLSTLTEVATSIFGTGGVVPTFFTWLTSSTVLPYFAIGIGVSLLLLGVKIVRGIIWGN